MSSPGAFKTLDKDNDGTIKVNVQEVRKLKKILLKFVLNLLRIQCSVI